jgi:peptidoglycan/LPS O-acetylase OafA/YrhL
MHTRTIHLVVGVFVLAVFLLTGYHMRFHIHHLMEADERLRFSLRGNHIYILLLGLLNLGLGAYLRVSQTVWRAYLQLVGSLMILTATGLVIVAFFFESKASLDRPFTLLTMILALTGTMLHAVSNIQKKMT